MAEWKAYLIGGEGEPPAAHSVTILPAGSLVVSPEQVEQLREGITQFVPDGFRDFHGVWHEGPWRNSLLSILDADRKAGR